MKREFITVGLFVAGLAAPAFGGDATPAAPVEEVGYDAILQKCEEFVNDPQLVPVEFKVSCHDESYTWQALEDKSVEGKNFSASADNSNRLGFHILMKEKYQTGDYNFAAPGEAIRCPVVAEYRTSRQAEIVVRCSEFKEAYRTPEELAARCGNVLTEAPKETAETGRYSSPCPMSAGEKSPET